MSIFFSYYNGFSFFSEGFISNWFSSLEMCFHEKKWLTELVKNSKFKIVAGIDLLEDDFLANTSRLTQNFFFLRSLKDTGVNVEELGIKCEAIHFVFLMFT